MKGILGDALIRRYVENTRSMIHRSEHTKVIVHLNYCKYTFLVFLVYAFWHFLNLMHYPWISAQFHAFFRKFLAIRFDIKNKISYQLLYSLIIYTILPLFNLSFFYLHFSLYKGDTTIHSWSFPLTNPIKSNNLAAIIIWSTSHFPLLKISGTAWFNGIINPSYNSL